MSFGNPLHLSKVIDTGCFPSPPFDLGVFKAPLAPGQYPSRCAPISAHPQYFLFLFLLVQLKVLFNDKAASYEQLSHGDHDQK